MTKKKIALLILSVGVLSSCTSMIQATKKTVDNQKKNTNSLYAKTNNYGRFFEETNSPYISSKTITYKPLAPKLPNNFSTKISFSGSSHPWQYYFNQIDSFSGINVRVSSDVESAINFNSTNKSNNNLNINYNGTLKGFLDEICSQLGIYWRYDFKSHQIIIFHEQTKIFKLAVPSSEIDNTTTISNSDKNNGSSIQYKISHSNEFQDALDTVKSLSKNNLTVSTDGSYALFTVTATPPVMAKVQNYINTFNQQAKKSIEVKISVYEVKTTKDSNYGIDWNLVYNGTHTTMNWNTMGISDALSDANLTTATVKAGIAGGMWAGSNIVASALQKYLNATFVQGFNFYALNGQSVPLTSGQSDAYVKNLAVTTLGGGGSVIAADNVQTSVQQATIHTGFTGSVLTNVIDNKIYMRMSLNFSKLLRLEKLEYGDAKHPSTIQLPHTETSKIIQNVILKSGQTAIITGFSSDDNQVGTASIGPTKWWWLGGNQGTQVTKNVLVVVVSAYQISGDKND